MSMVCDAAGFTTAAAAATNQNANADLRLSMLIEFLHGCLSATTELSVFAPGLRTLPQHVSGQCGGSSSNVPDSSSGVAPAWGPSIRAAWQDMGPAARQTAGPGQPCLPGGP